MTTIKNILSTAVYGFVVSAATIIGMGVATTVWENGLEDWVEEKTNALFKK